MSDENATMSTSSKDSNAGVAAVALSVEGLTDDVTGLRKQVKGLWIAFGVTIVLVVALAAASVVPRMMFGGPRAGQRFQPGAGQGFQGGPQQSAPAQ